MYKKLILLLNILLVLKQIEIDCTLFPEEAATGAKQKFSPKEMLDILQRIKEMESLIKLEQEEKLQQQEKRRRKIYQDILMARIKAPSVLKDFYSGRY